MLDSATISTFWSLHMLNRFRLISAIGIFAAGGAALAQSPNAIPSPAPVETPSADGQFVTAQTPDQILGSRLKGIDVLGPDGERIGDVSDILLDRDGTRVEAYIISVGGFLGIGTKNVALAPGMFEVVPREPQSSADSSPKLKISATKDQLKDVPNFAPYKRPNWATTGSGGLYASRALIEPGAMPPRDLAGYGLVAFTTRPAPDDLQRYKMICESYKATLMSQADLPGVPLKEQMVTFWPITNKNTPEARNSDCSHLVNNYALRVGLDAIQDADKHKEAFAQRRGPYLIAWAPSESRFVPDAVVLVMDLSSFDTQRSFTEMFQEWRQQITDRPELWRPRGFDVEVLRRLIRDKFDHYGEAVLRVIKG
jgi:sporulation protein YlmC with PRC-barrel domain